MFRNDSEKQIVSASLLLSANQGETYKQLDLIRHIDRSSFIIKVLNLLIFILFLIVFLVGVMVLRYFISAKKELTEKNEQIGFYNKKLIEKNAQLKNEVKRRMDESIFEMSQRELVMGSLQESDQKFSAAFYLNPEMILIFDLQTSFVVDVNESFLQFVGFEVVDVVEKNITESLLGFSEKCIEDIIQGLGQGEMVKDYRSFMGDTDANKKAISINASIINFGNKECCCMTIRDMSVSSHEQSQMAKLLSRYQKASPNFNEFIWSIDLDMKYEFVSESVEVLLGYLPSEMLRKSYLEVLSSTSQKIINDRITLVLSNSNSSEAIDKTICEELVYICKNGDFKTFLLIGEFVFDDGYLIRIEGVSKDVSKILELENEVINKQNFYSSILKSLNDIVLVFDDKLKMSFISDSVHSFIGYSADDVAKLPLNQYLTDKSIQKFKSLPSVLLSNSEKGEHGLLDEMDYEVDFIAQDGVLKTAYVRTRLLYDAKYQMLGYVSVLRDITIEKKMQEKNRKSEMYFKKLFDDSPVMMVITDDSDMILDANKAFVDTVGYSFYELKQMSFETLLKPDDYDSNEPEVKDVRAELWMKNDTKLNVLMTLADFTDSNQKQMNLFVIRDVTQQVLAENLRTIRENQYVAIAETSPNVLIRFDKTMACVYANKAVETHFKINMAEIIGKNPRIFVPDKAAAESIYQCCLSALIDEKEVAKDIKMNLNNQTLFYNLRVIPEVDAFGIVNSVICVVTNVTDYVSAIESLEKNIQQKAFLNQMIALCNKATNVENLFQSLHDVFRSQQYNIGFQGILLSQNHKIRDVIYSSLSFKGNADLLAVINDSNLVSRFTSSESYEDFSFLRDDVVLNGKLKSIEILPLLSKNKVLGFITIVDLVDKKLKWLISGVERLIMQEAGSAVHRILAEQKHFESNESYRQLVEATDDVVWRVNRDLKIVFISSKSNSLIGYLYKELLNMSFLSIIHDSYRNQVEQFVEMNAKAPEMFSFYDVPLIHKGGHLVAVEMQVYPIFDENKTFIGYSGVLRDIALRKLNEELRRSKEIAEGMSKLKQEFLDNISHEIRTPLNAIIGMTEIMGKKDMDDEQLQFMDAIKKNGNTLLSLINNVLDLSKMEAGKLLLNPDVLDLDEMLNDLFVAFMSLANSKGLILDFKIDPNLPKYIEMDGLRIRQVLLNLLSNAVKFTDSGYVRLEMSTTELINGKTNISIKIVDTGIGISNDEIDLIWESFVQSKNNNRLKHGGSGLGLDISKKIIELMKGSISVESEMNKGTCFTILLPGISVVESKQKSLTVFSENCVIIGFSTLDAQLLANTVLNSQLASCCTVFESIDEVSVVPKDAILLINENEFYKNKMNAFLSNFVRKTVAFVSQMSSYQTSLYAHVRCNSMSRFAIFDAVSRLKELNTIENSSIENLEISNTRNVDYSDFVFNEFFLLQADPLWTKVTTTNAINDMTEFSQLLLEFAEKNEVLLLKNYAQKMTLAIKMFDITKIQELIVLYPEIKKNILELF